MGLADHYVVKFTNDHVDAANYQLCDVDLSNLAPGTVAQKAAQIIAYFAAQMTEGGAEDTNIVGVMHTASGSSLGVPVPFPITEYSAIHAEFPAIPNLTAYNQNVGIAGNHLCPLGTSVCVSERTAVGGPAGRGRHFLPFIGRDVVSTAGFLNTSTNTNMVNNYRRFIQDTGAATSLGDLLPVVQNAAGTAVTLIDHVSITPVLSNLESRRR